MVEKLIQSNQPTEKVETKASESVVQRYREIDPYKRVFLINMVDAGGTYVTHSGKSIRFDRCGQVQPT